VALFRRSKVARDDFVALREWVASRRGVEAFVEPQTAVTPTTVVLVADDGEFIRRQVPSPRAATDFGHKAGIPVYDINRVGLPRRMREYALRQQAARAPVSGRQSVRTSRELDAIATLAGAAVMPVPRTDVDADGLRGLLRAARAKAHPDRNGGDRVLWDAVEEAAHVLGLR
jgi:hypothetical protein